ncbi:hypothetical protein F7734_52790 [Scytonema sp. UIC 10036]|uniref:helix-turn-helix domain-containing protein n=1 Tax=Scytonema sp. UIC 10036 TaxID=2304196 RepID=UPI0012DA4F30|nr:helix-turn-helix domain-containing protein [Scytonema sp. UIC 10036]MUH00493.1 hypothetical protein [Scytonema sp. UIC 10036]
MPKPLTVLESKAAQLISSGFTESQIAEACGKSRSWVQRLKRRPEFQEIVGNSTKEIAQVVTQVVVEDVRKSLTEDLEVFRQRYSSASTLIYELAIAYLNKLKERVENLDSLDISEARIPQSLKSVTESVMLAFEANRALLGIDELIQDVEDIKEINTKRLKSANEHQLNSSGIEVN